MEAGGTQIESGRVISEAFENYRNYAGPLLAGALLMVGIAGVISGVLEASDSLLLGLLGLIVYIAAGVLYTYVVKLVQDVRDGRRDHSVEGLFESAAPYIGTLILNGILAAIGIGIGLSLLIVPGLILITIWAVVAPAIVVEGRRGDRGVRAPPRPGPGERLAGIRSDRDRLSDRPRRVVRDGGGRRRHRRRCGTRHPRDDRGHPRRPDPGAGRERPLLRSRRWRRGACGLGWTVPSSPDTWGIDSRLSTDATGHGRWRPLRDSPCLRSPASDWRSEPHDE
jgi:hypothetical protein